MTKNDIIEQKKHTRHGNKTYRSNRFAIGNRSPSGFGGFQKWKSIELIRSVIRVDDLGLDLQQLS
jgi:hypothetical protein